MKKFAFMLIAGVALSSTTSALAWSDHARSTYLALSSAPEITQAALVTAEPLDQFLRDQEPAIAALLAQQDLWAGAHFEAFPRLPAPLAFTVDSGRGDAARRKAFLTALRVAPDARFALYVISDLPGFAPEGAMPLAMAAISTLPAPVDSPTFSALAPGDQVSPLAVIASASEEPDYGLDINCWSDSPGDWGKTYGFGPLPFGNPALSFSTQAPFHMGFYHESSVLMAAWPALKRTYPALRAHQFSTLAALAFKSGHDYWGWRFAGMALHYVQDATQPHHTRALANRSTAAVLGFHILNIMGYPKLERDMIVLASNRHMVFERYTTQLVKAQQAGAGTSLLNALADGARDTKYPAWTDRTFEDVVAADSNAVSDKLDDLLGEVMPAKHVKDPNVDFDPDDVSVDLLAAVAGAPAEPRAQLEQLIADRLASFGAHTRRGLRVILTPGRAG